jgi:alpha-beta hydrolase superfamily lysophospholipase
VHHGAAVLGRHLADHDLRDAVLVAHSKGGLIGKQAMLREDPDDRLRSMIAVNTPFAGSVHARWFVAPAVRAFIPTDATILALAAERQVNHRITSVYSHWDPHIPAGSALDGAEAIVLDTPGHFRPLGDPRLHSLLLERLVSPGGAAEPG